MKKIDIVKQISMIKLDNNLITTVGSSWDDKKKIVWGAGVSGKSFVEMFSNLNFSYIVDTREALIGTYYNNIEIVHPDYLFNEIPDNTIVFLPTVMCQEISELLISKNFKNIIIPNQLNKSGVGLVIKSNKIKDFFNWLNTNHINYALLRWHQEGIHNIKDVDIMLDSNDIDKLLNCDLILNDYGATDLIYLDIKWSAPIGLNIELPYFPIKLTSQILLNQNTHWYNGIRIIKDQYAIYSYIYHILFQKVELSNLTISGENINFNNKYYKILFQLRNTLNLDFEISLEGLWVFIMNSEMKPPIDFVRKWADETNSPFLKFKSQIKVIDNQEQIAVFVFRNWFKENIKYLDQSINLIGDFGFVLEKIQYLDEHQITDATNHIRGGVWFETFDSRLGGVPYCFGIFKHKNLSTRPAKEAVRKFISMQLKMSINCIHASDDQYEALEYLEIINY